MILYICSRTHPTWLIQIKDVATQIKTKTCPLLWRRCILYIKSESFHPCDIFLQRRNSLIHWIQSTSFPRYRGNVFGNCPLLTKKPKHCLSVCLSISFKIQTLVVGIKCTYCFINRVLVWYSKKKNQEYSSCFISAGMKIAE